MWLRLDFNVVMSHNILSASRHNATNQKIKTSEVVLIFLMTLVYGLFSVELLANHLIEVLNHHDIGAFKNILDVTVVSNRCN